VAVRFCLCLCVCVCVCVIKKKNSQAEKISRGALKTAVERGLTRTETLIADDLNYIKGYRYEVCVCVCVCARAV
jgi:tRNA uridine 5-carbamoylmethylation protein Kti12